jgi:cytochrome c oxidase assembly protein subunit 15
MLQKTLQGSESAAHPPRLAAVRSWLIVVAALIAAMVIVGGATRLTESGLSIVEWKPVTGTLPPLSDAAWHEAFEGYKTIPQYREMNAGMTLAEFKIIFWWEWAHRLLGRVIGLVYLLPFLFFLWRGGLDRTLKRRLWVIFGLGALQGAVGWWMVVSGLTQRVEVSQYRLAAHLVLALIIFAGVVWTLLRMRPPVPAPARPAPARLRATAVALTALTFLQIYLGALVAGLRAGKAYNTWPLIDGALIPDAARLFFETPWWRNFFDNVLTVQFSHRMVAYLLWAVALWHLIDVLATRASATLGRGAVALFALVSAQAALGIWTLLESVPLGPALLHQGGAIVVLTIVLAQLDATGRDRVVPRVSVPATA